MRAEVLGLLLIMSAVPAYAETALAPNYPVGYPEPGPAPVPKEPQIAPPIITLPAPGLPGMPERRSALPVAAPIEARILALHGRRVLLGFGTNGASLFLTDGDTFQLKGHRYWLKIDDRVQVLDEHDSVVFEGMLGSVPVERDAGRLQPRSGR